MLHQLRAQHGAATGASLLFEHLPELLHSPDALALALAALPREPRMRAALYAKLCAMADKGADLPALPRIYACRSALAIPACMPYSMQIVSSTSTVGADLAHVTVQARLSRATGTHICCSDAWPIHAGALPDAAQAKLAAHLAAELAMLAGTSDGEPQRVCTPPVAAADASPGQTLDHKARTRSDRAASVAPPAGWLRLGHHLPAALRLALAVGGTPPQREGPGSIEGAVQGGGGAAGATAVTVMRHLSHTQHVAALLTAKAPPPVPPSVCWEKELESRGASAGGFFAVLGALNAARASGAALVGGDSAAAGRMEDALLAGVDGWRERARICQVCKPTQAVHRTVLCMCRTPPWQCQNHGALDLAICTWHCCSVSMWACIMTSRGQACHHPADVMPFTLQSLAEVLLEALVLRRLPPLASAAQHAGHEAAPRHDSASHPERRLLSNLAALLTSHGELTHVLGGKASLCWLRTLATRLQVASKHMQFRLLPAYIPRQVSAATCTS